MIVHKILGNIYASDCVWAQKPHQEEKVILTSQDLVKRIQRLRSERGRELGLRLSAQAPDLKDGDILAVDESGELPRVLLVSVEKSDVLVIAAKSIVEMAFVAHSLGNRHLQAQFFDRDSEYGQEVMVVQYDHTVSDFLQQHGVPYSRQQRLMPVPFRHAEHTH